MTIYLYVKQHSVTGLKYFGMTRSKDPFKYQGSGLHWRRHLKKHGNFIKTIEIWGFDIQELCTDFALKFSIQNNIVESAQWANMKPENALDGWVNGFKMTNDTKNKMSMAAKGKPKSLEAIHKSATNRSGVKRTSEQKARISEGRKNQTRPKHSEETKLKISTANLNKKYKKHSNKANMLKSVRQTGKKNSNESIAKISKSKKGVTPKQTQCPHCNKTGSLTTMHRWHFNNCKNIKY